MKTDYVLVTELTTAKGVFDNIRAVKERLRQAEINSKIKIDSEEENRKILAEARALLVRSYNFHLLHTKVEKEQVLYAPKCDSDKLPESAPKLSENVAKSVENSTNAAEIIKIVSNISGVRESDILSRRLERNARLSRMIVYWLCSRFCDLSSVEIGRCLKGRDHSTVLSGIRVVEAIIKNKAAKICLMPVETAALVVWWLVAP